MTFRILKLDHIGTLVRNVEKAADTWRDALGVDSPAPHHAPEVGMTTAMLDFNNAGIDLIQPDADTDAGRRMEKKGEGIYVVTFLVEDLADVIRQFEAKGWRVFEPWGPWRETGVCAVHPRDTMGVFMQLMEDRPGGAFEHSSYLGARRPPSLGGQQLRGDIE